MTKEQLAQLLAEELKRQMGKDMGYFHINEFLDHEPKANPDLDDVRIDGSLNLYEIAALILEKVKP